MSDPSHDPSIEHEPHRRSGPLDGDPSEHTVEPILASRIQTEAERVEHTVWDEPALNPQLSGPVPKDALTYARWLEGNRAATSPATSRLVVLLVAAVSGPWAILGALWNSGNNTLSSLFMLAVVGPLSEEVMKSAGTLWVIEKRPYLFQSARQIMFCVLCSAFCFAAIENALYLLVYIDDPDDMIILWRWTICVALHMSCTAISGVGLTRIWSETMTHLKPPELSFWVPPLLVAATFHGIYNFTAFVFEASTDFF